MAPNNLQKIYKEDTCLNSARELTKFRSIRAFRIESVLTIKKMFKGLTALKQYS